MRYLRWGSDGFTVRTDNVTALIMFEMSHTAPASGAGFVGLSSRQDLNLRPLGYFAPSAPNEIIDGSQRALSAQITNKPLWHEKPDGLRQRLRFVRPRRWLRLVETTLCEISRRGISETGYSTLGDFHPKHSCKRTGV